MEILVFKTDISNRRAVNKIIPRLETIDGIIRCNVDLHDRDKILRIESSAVSPRIIEHQVQQAGHYCKELED